MSSGNSGDIGSPSRRALLRAAAAGGAFAVPLIASFSMDTASAQTRSEAVHSSNQVYVSNMFCSNMTSVPTSVFFAELQELNGDEMPTGPVVGLAALEFEHGRNELHYQLVLAGTVSAFRVSLDDTGSSFEVLGRSKIGQVPGSLLDCGNRSMNTVYSGLAAGGSTIEVDLSDDVSLLGVFGVLAQDSPLRRQFSLGTRG